MEYLEKEISLIKRNTEGELLPLDVTLELVKDKPTVQMTPLTKGDLQEILSVPDKESELVRKHLIQPSYSEEEFEFIQPTMYGAMKMALLGLSTGASQKEMQDSTVKALVEDAKKKVTNPKEN